MRHDPAKEYEARVPCDVHGVVWAKVTDRWPDGSPLAAVCPDCVASVVRQAAEYDPHLLRDPDALRELAERVAVPMTLLATPGPGQVRERDAARTAEESLNRPSAPMTPQWHTGGDDDGE